mgnify:CR=1 FL=1
MKIKAILTIYTAARDRNGNSYHAAKYTDTATGAVVRFGNISGANNMSGLAKMLGFADYDSDAIYTTHQTLPIREWQRLTKDWPYVCNHADAKAVAAIQVAVSAQDGR